MAHEAKLSLATCVSAKLVETEQTQYWVDDRRSLADVVNLLDFGSKTPSPVFRLINFYERICKVHPESFFDLHDVLKKFYSDAMLAKLIVEAMSKNLSGVNKLKDILFSHWFNIAISRERLNELLETNNENMKQAFDPLLDSFDVFVAQLKKNTANLVDPISLNTELSYDDMLTDFEKQLYLYNTKNPFKQLNLLALLSLHLSDEFVNKLLGESKLMPSTRDFFEILETQRIQHWADGDVPLDKAIERNHHSDSLSKNYIPDNELITFIGEATSVSLENAEQLKKMLFRNWFNRAMKPTDIKKRDDQTNPRFELDLKEYSNYYTLAQRRLLEHVGDLKSKNSDAGSVFADFITLIRDLNKKNPTEQLSVFAALTACFNEHEASAMIEAAKLDPSTKEIALQLETEQIEYWLDTGKTPLDVVKLLDFENERFNSNAKQLRDMLFQHWYVNCKSSGYLEIRFNNRGSSINKRVLKLYNEFITKYPFKQKEVQSFTKDIEPKKADYIFDQVLELNENNHENRPIHPLATLTALIRDESTISKILEVGRQLPDRKELAISLQKLRSERWPELLTWVEYVVAFNQEYKNDAESMFEIVKNFAPKLDWKIAFSEMAKDPRWEKVAGQIKKEHAFCMKAQIPIDYVLKLSWLDVERPNILENQDFKDWVSYSVLLKYSNSENTDDLTALIILKESAQTDTTTLIERLKQATSVKTRSPWNHQVCELMIYYRAKEDQLLISAWVDYVSTLDVQPLGWNIATILSTIVPINHFINTVVLKAKAVNRVQILHPLIRAMTETKQKYKMLFKHPEKIILLMAINFVGFLTNRQFACLIFMARKIGNSCAKLQVCFFLIKTRTCRKSRSYRPFTITEFHTTPRTVSIYR
ncbi:hypothetical protein Plhal304r1_c031g0100701 [Plasmopara halstedii]